MHTAPHFGIRYESDLTHRCSEYIVDSVDLLNAQLAPHEMGFYFDSVDFRQQMIGGKHCWDMYGWVVPNDAVNDFEPIWLAGDDEKLEGYDYACASWGGIATACRTQSLTVIFLKRRTDNVSPAYAGVVPRLQDLLREEIDRLETDFGSV